MLHTRMTRARLYILVDSFESDVRQMILRFVLDHMSEVEALADSYERAADRRHADASDDELSIVEYLDMREAYDILNRHREALPLELARNYALARPVWTPWCPYATVLCMVAPYKQGMPRKQ